MNATVVDRADSGIARLAPARAAFRTVMVHVGPEVRDLPRLDSAVDLARLLDATLHGVAAEMAPPVSFVDPVGGTDSFWLVECKARIQADLRQAEALFRARTAALRTQWTALEAAPATLVADLSCTADLIVASAGAQSGASRYSGCDPASLVLLSGRPVLLAPSNGRKLSAEAVIVAWKDTREARRALADALPFLRSAREVVVVEVAEHGQPGGLGGGAQAVASGLARHGVSARAKRVAGATEDVAGQLEAAAQAVGADLIVAGGYGRSRVGEWMFGGASRDLLQTNDRFLLMSH